LFASNLLRFTDLEAFCRSGFKYKYPLAPLPLSLFFPPSLLPINAVNYSATPSPPPPLDSTIYAAPASAAAAAAHLLSLFLSGSTSAFEDTSLMQCKSPALPSPPSYVSSECYPSNSHLIFRQRKDYGKFSLHHVAFDLAVSTRYLTLDADDLETSAISLSSWLFGIDMFYLSKCNQHQSPGRAAYCETPTQAMNRSFSGVATTVPDFF
jgi:hypothetical protein